MIIILVPSHSQPLLIHFPINILFLHNFTFQANKTKAIIAYMSCFYFEKCIKEEVCTVYIESILSNWEFPSYIYRFGLYPCYTLLLYKYEVNNCSTYAYVPWNKLRPQYFAVGSILGERELQGTGIFHLWPIQVEFEPDN